MGTPITRIFLTGFSGTGKTAIAPLVAEALGWQSLDTDALVEEDAGRSVGEVFEKDGEDRFRELEATALRSAAQSENIVIATGGGALLAEANRRLMAGRGVLVCLQAQSREILSRLKDAGPVSERPLLTGPDPLAAVVDLKARRHKFYALADVSLRTDRQAPQQVAAAVVEALRSIEGLPLRGDRFLLPEEIDSTFAESIWVDAPSRRHAAHIGWGTLDKLGVLLAEAGLSGAAYIISDSEVLPKHGERALRSLREAGFHGEAFAVQSGETSKTLDAAGTIYDWLSAHRAERGHAVVALGGGVVGDLAGFVASTYLRGVPFVQAPTSLLAMVDAAIGGKVAVDLERGKNLVGTFYQPWLVVEDLSTLKTLPRRALIEGCAEVLKHALIFDADLLRVLEERAEDLLALNPSFSVDVVRRSVALKGRMVAEDELDKGPRNVLNYGHTIGHAIEAAAGYKGVLHGEAVAVGMMAAAEVGRRMEITPPDLVERQRALLEQYGLPIRRRDGWPALDPRAVLSGIALDKKVAKGSVRWVLLEDVGRTVFRSDVPAETVEAVVTGLLS
jgi:shikimate kinase / 3-dehydroquinate synthase